LPRESCPEALGATAARVCARDPLGCARRPHRQRRPRRVGRYGSVAPDGSAINPLTFLERAYKAGLRKAPIDAIGWQPHSCRANGSASDMLSTDQPTSAWAQMAWTTPNARSLMEANGDANLRIDATEWGAPTNTSAFTTGVTEEEQAKLIAAGIAA